MVNRNSLNHQHLAYLHQQGTLAIAASVQRLVRQDLDQAQVQQAARLQAALEAHLVRPQPQRK